MNVLVAMDSFKGSLSSMEAGNAVKEGIKRVYQGADVLVCQVADGGEGTVHALAAGLGGSPVTVRVTGPLGEPVNCEYILIKERKTAVIEMAGAAGLILVPKEKRNPMHTTTYGVGEVVMDAIRRGCRRFIIGIGGSATNDGGAGMLQALGIHFFKRDGTEIARGAEGLKDLVKIDIKDMPPVLRECKFQIACDVANPLCGMNGCSFVFAPGKGARAADIIAMDEWLKKYSELAKEVNLFADRDKRGAGAAGGMGFAFQTFLRGKLVSGADLIMKGSGLEGKIQAADLVITGEGRLDSQTLGGKVPIGIAGLAKKYDKPVIALAGSIGGGAEACLERGILAYFPVVRGICTEAEAMEAETAKRNLADTAEQVFRILGMGKNEEKGTEGT